MLLAPRLYLLAYRTRTRHQRDEPHTLLQAQPQRAFTIGLTVGHNAADPVEAKGDTFLNRYGVSVLSLVFPSRRPMRNGSPSLLTPRLKSAA